MKLISVQIKNFRSVDDSGKFEIGDTTCLVGKNEAGKTALLQALEVLNSAEGNDQYDKLRDYPRQHLNKYEERHGGREAVVAITEWSLDAEDRAAVEAEFGSGCLREHTITVSKHYELTTTSWTTHFDEKVAIKHLVSQANFNASEKSIVDKCTSARQLITELENRANTTEKQDQFLEKLKGYRDSNPALKAIDILARQLPKFLYFSHYDRMSGKISVNQLNIDEQNDDVSDGDSVFLDFLEFAGSDLEELKSLEDSEHLTAKVEAASIQITDRIFEYWSQNKSLSVQFKIFEGKHGDEPPFNSGTVMEARILNQIHRVTVPFSERSSGFIWFFSFLVKFSQVTKEHENIIILLDEPGLTLHAKAQADLLRFFKEKLEPNHQLIYTCHSPFMVPADNLMSVKTVEDVVTVIPPNRFDSKGTKVGDKVLSTDKDTLFPLQGALGYEITQTLFVGEHTLLVEGPSDLLYLQAVSGVLEQTGRRGLDSRWTLCPTGGIDKVSSFVSLFGANDLHIAVLTDIAKGQKKKIENLRRSEVLEQGHVFTIGDFCEQDEADIEDLFSATLFAKIVNEAYDLPAKHKLTKTKLSGKADSTKRKVIHTEAHFRLLPDSIPMFDHYTPSSWLIQNPGILAGDGNDVKETLERFEKVFETFNNLLPKR